MFYFRSICTSFCSLCNPAHSWSRTAIWQRRERTENLHTASSTRVRRPACDYCYRVLFRPLFSIQNIPYFGCFSLAKTSPRSSHRPNSFITTGAHREGKWLWSCPSLKAPFHLYSTTKTISFDVVALLEDELARRVNPEPSPGSVHWVREQQHRRRRLAILIVAVISCSSSTSSTCRVVLGVDGDAEREYRRESVRA